MNDVVEIEETYNLTIIPAINNRPQRAPKNKRSSPMESADLTTDLDLLHSLFVNDRRANAGSIVNPNEFECDQVISKWRTSKTDATFFPRVERDFNAHQVFIKEAIDDASFRYLRNGRMIVHAKPSDIVRYPKKNIPKTKMDVARGNTFPLAVRQEANTQSNEVSTQPELVISGSSVGFACMLFAAGMSIPTFLSDFYLVHPLVAMGLAISGATFFVMAKVDGKH